MRREIDADGLPKGTLTFGAETMLQRVVRLLGTVVSPIVVVAARGQSLPTLPVGSRSRTMSRRRGVHWKACEPA